MREQQTGSETPKSIGTMVAYALEAVVGIPTTAIVMAFLAILSVASVFVTCYAQLGEPSDTITVLSEFGSSGIIRQIVVPIAVALVTIGVMLALRNRIRIWKTRHVIVVCLALAFAIQYIWTISFMTGVFSFNDTIQVDAYAQALNNGEMSAFVGVADWDGPVTGSVPSYLIRVPYQAGMVWLFAGIYRIFGNGNLNAIAALNLVANMVSICCLLGIVATTTGNRRDGSDMPLKLTAILTVLFLPFLMSATFVYSNAISFALVMLSCLVSAVAWEHAGSSYATDAAAMLVSAVLMSAAIMFKQTFLLFAIILCLCWLVHELKSGRVAMIVPVAVMGYAFLHAVDLPIACLEQATGVDFGDGQPLFTNITLGLTWSKANNAPGWYSGVAFDCYNGTDGSIPAQSEWCMEYIGKRLSGMRDDPGYALYFFRYKLASEWLDPTYQSCWFSLCSGGSGMIRDMAFTGNRENTLLVAILDGWQTAIYMLATIGAWASLQDLRRHRLPLWQLMLVGMTMIGAVVYLLWEAQAMYILPFAFLLLPLSAVGGSMVYNRLSERSIPDSKASNEAEREDIDERAGDE